MGAGFGSYLPHVVPLAIASLEQDDGECQPGSDDDHALGGLAGSDSGSEGEGSGGRAGGGVLSVRTGVLDEKAAALSAISQYAQHAGPPHFVPYLLPCLQQAAAGAVYFHEEIRAQVGTGHAPKRGGGGLGGGGGAARHSHKHTRAALGLHLVHARTHARTCRQRAHPAPAPPARASVLLQACTAFAHLVLATHAAFPPAPAPPSALSAEAAHALGQAAPALLKALQDCDKGVVCAALGAVKELVKGLGAPPLAPWLEQVGRYDGRYARPCGRQQLRMAS